MKTKAPQIIIWAVAVILTARITWTLIQHDVPALATAAAAVSLLLTTKQGMDVTARSITAARKNGAAR